MTTAFEASIVPIALTVNGRTGLTLWAPPWEDEDGEEWQGFLGDGAKIVLFPTARDLADFVASGEENDLSDHPAWGRVLRLTPDEFRPADDDRFDLDEVYELAADDPDPVHVSRLANIVDIVEKIADCCDDGALRRLVGNTPSYAELVQDDVSYQGKDGRRRWSELGDTIAETWERALGRVESWLSWRGDFDTVEGQDDIGSPWERIGAEPIRIVLPKQTYLTMRAELDDEVLFLGAEQTVAVFTDRADLARYAQQAREHELTRLQWWEEIRDVEDEQFEPRAEYDLRKPTARGASLLRELAVFCDLDADLDDLEEPLDRGVFGELRDEIVTCLQQED
jgi:hypothetical protein